MIYLDNAATSYPKPDSVYQSAQYFMTRAGNPGRGGYKMALDTSLALYEVREKAAEFFNCPLPENVIFTPGATHALNVAIYSVARPNTRVLTTVLEHNSVLRPLYDLEKQGVQTVFVKPDFYDKQKTLYEFDRKLPGCAAAVVSCCSNVNGYNFPLEEIGKMCVKYGAILVVDGSQGGGYMDIDIQRQNIDFLCLPGHKGLLGLCGAGLLIANRGREQLLRPLILGGSGSASKSRKMPDFLPDRLEAGTLPVLPILTIGAGLDYINRVGKEHIYQASRGTAEYARQLLQNIGHVRVYDSFNSIVLFNVENLSCDEASELLDGQDIALRSGFHCAPLAHEFLNTGSFGALRASFGAFNTQGDAEALAEALQKIKKI